MLAKSFLSKTTRITLVSTFVLGFGLKAHALVNFGLKGGVGLTNVVTSPTSNSGDSGKGAIGGISLDLGMSPVSFVADVLYAKRTYGTGSSAYILDTIHVPVQLKFSLLPALFTTAGGYYAMGVGDTDSFTNLGLKTTDLGAVVGIGAALPLGALTITAEARYNIGLTNIIENPVGSLSIKNRHLDILIGLRF
jgi:hypothetical protein